MLDKDQPMLRVSELAAILNISMAHAYHLIYTGELPAVKLGYSWRVPPFELENRLTEKLASQQKNYNNNNTTNINSNN